jgi:hypothetical protein
LEQSGIPDGPIVKNLKCALTGTAYDICSFDPRNAIIESLSIRVNIDEPVVIPTRYKDLRFLEVTFVYTDRRNVNVVIDGFPNLEFIEIYSRVSNGATCRIANVPYIMSLVADRHFDLDIDHETVSILEQRK